MDFLKNNKIKDKNLMRLLMILVFVTVLFSILKGNLFLSLDNFTSMGKQFPEFALLAIAMALSLFIGGIDLSIVYIATLGMVVIAKLLPMWLREDMSQGQIILYILLSFLIAIVIGALCGIFNGTLISIFNIPPILATLGTQALFQGISIVLTGGSTLTELPVELSGMINKIIIGIPITAIIFVICAVIIDFILSKTTLGYRIKMLGTNPKATIFSGLSNVKLTIYTYMMGGILAAISGIIMLGRFNSAKADYGASYTMQSILIAVMGGIDPNGGKGNIKGVIVAVFIIQMVSSWLNMYENISNFYRQIIWGVLLIFVLIFNYYINRKQKNGIKKVKAK